MITISDGDDGDKKMIKMMMIIIMKTTAL